MGQLVGVAQEPGCNVCFYFLYKLGKHCYSNLACTLNTFFCISFSCVTALLHKELPAVVNVDLTGYFRKKEVLVIPVTADQSPAASRSLGGGRWDRL